MVQFGPAECSGKGEEKLSEIKSKAVGRLRGEEVRHSQKLFVS